MTDALSPAQIAAMTPAERMARLETLALQRYGKRGMPDKLGAELGTSRTSVYRWRQDPASMPLSVLIALELLETPTARDDRALATELDAAEMAIRRARAILGGSAPAGAGP